MSGLAAARQFSDPRSEASLLITLGTARNQASPRDLRELEEGAEIADRLNLPLEYTRGHNNIAELLLEDGDIEGAATHVALALKNGERLGVVSIVVWLLPQVAAVGYHGGHWTSADESLRRYRHLRETTTANYTESQAEATRAAIAFGRGEAEADAIWQHAVALGREMKDPQARMPALSGCARFLVESGRHDEAAALYEEILGPGERYLGPYRPRLGDGRLRFRMLLDATRVAASGASRARISRGASSRPLARCSHGRACTPRRPTLGSGPPKTSPARSAVRCSSRRWRSTAP